MIMQHFSIPNQKQYRYNLRTGQIHITLSGSTGCVFSLHSMEGAYRKRRFIYREARGAAAWRPVVMRTVPPADGREAILRGRDHQSQAYVRSIAQGSEKGLRQQSDRCT